MKVREVTLSIDNDLDGTAVALRGWLASAGAEVPWTVLPPGRSEGQGVGETIALGVESASALLEIYDHVRRWISNRGKHAEPVTATVLAEIDGKTYEMVVTMNPLDDRHARAS